MKLGKIIRFIFFIAFMAVLSGCGSSVVTEFTINHDTSGVREIKYTENYASDQEYIKSSPEEIITMVSSACPSGMTCTGDYDSGIITFDFRIEFSSIDDYTAKVRSILNAGSITAEPEITYKMNDSPLISDIVYHENFTTDDLLHWMVNLAVNQNVVGKTDSGYVVQSSQEEVYFTYNGVRHKCNLANQYALDYSGEKVVNSINFRTSFNNDETIDRDIEISLISSTYQANKAVIDAFLASHTSSSTSVSWTSKDTLSIYTISGSHLNADDADAMLSAFTSGSNTLEFQPSGNQNFPQISVSADLNEAIDLNQYVSTGEVPVTYEISTVSSFEGTYTLDQDTKSINMTADASALKNNYSAVFQKNDPKQINISLHLSNPVSLDSLELSTSIEQDNHLKRAADFLYSVHLADNVISQIESNLQSVLPSNAKVSAFNDQDQLCIHIETDHLFLSDDKSTWCSICNTDSLFTTDLHSSGIAHLTRSVDRSFTEEISLSGLLPNTVRKFTYHLNGIGDALTDGGEGTFVDGVYTIEKAAVQPSDTLTISVSGSTRNRTYPLLLIILIVLIAGLAALTGYTVLMIRRSRVLAEEAKIYLTAQNSEKLEKVPAEVQNDRTHYQGQPAKECPYCHTMNYKNALICRKCSASLFIKEDDYNEQH